MFGFSNAGFAILQAPEATAAAWQVFASEVKGRKLAGLIGVPDQVGAAKQALGVVGADFSLDRPEPLYRLALADLHVPSTALTLHPPRESDRELLFQWTRAYSEELQMSAPEKLDEEGRRRAEWAITTGDARLLWHGETPCAMTAFNARLPDMVQIGGVYTPPALRGLGYARSAVALHLLEARGEGVETAILFASGPAACRAYEAIGFERIGAYMLSILTHPLTIGDTP